MDEILCKIIDKKIENVENPIICFQGFTSGGAQILDNSAISSSSAEYYDAKTIASNTKKSYNYNYDPIWLLYNKNNKYYRLYTTTAFIDWRKNVKPYLSENDWEEFEVNDAFNIHFPSHVADPDVNQLAGIKIKKDGYYKLNGQLEVKSNNNAIYSAINIFKFRPFIYYISPNEEGGVLIAESFSEAVKKYYIIDGLGSDSSLLNKYSGVPVEIKYKNTGGYSDGMQKRIYGKWLKYNENWHDQEQDYIRNKDNWDNVNWSTFSNTQSMYGIFNMLFPDGAYIKNGEYVDYQNINSRNYSSYYPCYCIASSQVQTIPNYYLPLRINSKICYLNKGDVLYFVYSARNTDTKTSYSVYYPKNDSFYFSVEYLGWRGEVIINNPTSEEEDDDGENELLSVTLPNLPSENIEFADFVGLGNNINKTFISTADAGIENSMGINLMFTGTLESTTGIGYSNDEKHKYILLDIGTKHGLVNPTVNGNDIDNNLESSVIEQYAEANHYWVQIDAEQLTTEGTPLIIEDSSITIILHLFGKL